MTEKLVVSFANVDAVADMISQETWEAMGEVSKAKETIKRGAHWLLFRLQCDFGGGSSDEARAKGEAILREFPRVGSEYKQGSNQVSDLNPSEGTKKDGTKTDVKVSFYAKLWDVSPSGIAHAAEVQAHDDAKATWEDGIAWDNEKSRLVSRRSNEINKLKEAMKLFQKIGDVHDFIGNANVFLALEGEGDNKRPTFGPKGVIIENTETRKQKSVTPGQFLAMSVTKAVEGGATLSALLATVGKGSSDGPTAFIKPIEKVEQADQVIAEFASFMQHKVMSKTDTKMYKAFLAHLNEAGSDGLLLSLSSIVTVCETILGLPTYANRLERLIEAGETADTVRRAQLAAKLQATG